MQSKVTVLLGAVVVDVLFGEPPTALHPVVWIGEVQGFLRQRAPKTAALGFAWGVMMAILGPALFGGGAWLLLDRVHGLARWIFGVYLLKSAFSIRELAAAALRVKRPLEGEDLPAARVALSGIVSRETTRLTPGLIAAASIESVAENCSDSIVAPLFFFVLAGVPGAIAYRAVNTLDAMIGYRGQFEWLGKAAARIDDLANLVPARLTALLLSASACVSKGSATRALATWWRDRSLTESPNAGHPMSAMAGALGVELEKVGAYRLGAGGGVPVAFDITRAVRVMCTAALLATVLALVAAMRVGHGA